MEATTGSVELKTRTITFQPHHNAVVKSGDATLSKFTHALAEFIDNSIEGTFKACKKGDILPTEPRIVSVNVLTHSLNSGRDPPPSFLTIADNGCGMTHDEIENFAKFALDKASRGEAPLAQETASIGKFGVGAKQSGFWLGNRIRIITKNCSASTPAPASEEVLEFTLDSELMDARSKSGDGGVYVSDIISRAISTHTNPNQHMHEKTPEDELKNSKLMELIKAHELKNPDHFTFIVVRLKQDKANEFFKDTNTTRGERYRHFPSELAQIYHFHLHPEHTPGNIDKLDKFNHSVNRKKGRDRSMYPQGSLKFGSTKSQPESPLNIFFSIYEIKPGMGTHKPIPGYHDLSLKDVHDAVSQHVEKAGAVWRFIVNIPKPESERTKVLSQAAKSLGNVDRVNEVHKSEVQGMIFYFPFENGTESRPLPSKEGNHWTGGHEGSFIDRPGGKSSSRKSQSQSPGKDLVAGNSTIKNKLLKRNAQQAEGDDDDDDDEQDEPSRKHAGGGGAEDPNSVFSHMEIESQASSEEEEDEVFTPTDSSSQNTPELDLHDRSDILHREEQNLFDIYWSERLLPNSHAKNMPKIVFSSERPAECVANGIAHNWRERLKGYLFFDNQWKSITNNKLSLCLGAGLDNYLSDKHVLQDLSVIHGTKEDFKKFVQECHKHLDREFLCRERMTELESEVKGSSTRDALFRHISWGGRGDGTGVELSAGDMVKMHITPLSKVASKTKTNPDDVVLGKIVCFSVANQCKKNDEEFHGAPTVHYLRLPLDVYHPGVDEKKLFEGNPKALLPGDRFKPKKLAYEANKTPVNIQAIFHPRLNFENELTKNSTIKATESDLKKLRAQAVDSIAFYLFEKVGGPGKLVEGDTIELEADNRDFNKFGIQLLQKNNEPITCTPPPHIGSDSMYSVRTYFEGSGDNEKTEKNLWFFDRISGKDVMLKNTAKKHLPDVLSKAYYTIYGPQRNGEWGPIHLNYGETTLKIEVLQTRQDGHPGSHVVLTRTVTLNVSSGSVDSWRMDIIGNDQTPQHMHSFLPRMQIELLDKNNEIAKDAQVRLTVKIEAMGTKKTQMGPLRVFDGSRETLWENPRYISEGACACVLDPSDEGRLLIGHVAENTDSFCVNSEDREGRRYQSRASEAGGLWLPVFPTDGSFSDDAHFTRKGKPVKFKVEIEVQDLIHPGDGETENEYEKEGRTIGSPNYFEVVFHSTWKLAEIKRVLNRGEEEGVMTLNLGQTLAELKFQCYDRFGLKVNPGLGPFNRSWKFVLDCECLHGVMTAEANIHGVIVFDQLRVKDEWTGPEFMTTAGVKAKIIVRALTNHDERMKQPWDGAPMSDNFNSENYLCFWEPKTSFLDKLYEKGYTGDTDHRPKDQESLDEYYEYSRECSPPEYILPIAIFSDSKPCSVKIFRGGVAVTDKVQITCGSDIDDLTLRVFDKNDKQIKWEARWFPGKKTKYVEVTWNKKSAPRPTADFCDEIALPPIPQSVFGNQKFKIDASVTFNSFKVSFAIEPRGGRPVEWILITSDLCTEEGVQVGELEDFQSKFLRVAMVDENGFNVPHTGAADEPLPEVFVYGADPELFIDDATEPADNGADSNDEDDEDDEDDDDDEGDCVRAGGSPLKKKKRKQQRAEKYVSNTKKYGAKVSSLNMETDEGAETADEDSLGENAAVNSDQNSMSTTSAKKRQRERDNLASRNSRRRGPAAFEHSKLSHKYVLEVRPYLGPNGREFTHEDRMGKEEGYFYFHNLGDRGLTDPSIEGPEGDKFEDRFVWIVVKDKNSQLTGFIKKVKLTSCIPAKMRIKCPEMLINEWKSSSEVIAQLNKYVANPTLVVELLDKYGYPALTKSRKIRHLEVKVSLAGKRLDGKKGEDVLKPNVVQHSKFELRNFSIKRAFKMLTDQNGVAVLADTVDTSTILDRGQKAHVTPTSSRKTAAATAMDVEEAEYQADEESNQQHSVSLHVTCSFEYVDNSITLITLDPIEIICQQLLLNNVIEVSIAAVDHNNAGSGELTVTADSIIGLGKLNVSLITSDGKPLADADLQRFLDIGLKKELIHSDKRNASGAKRKYLEYPHYFLVPTVNDDKDGITMQAIPEDTRNSEVMWKLGYYTLEVTYDELRKFDGLTFPEIKSEFSFQVVAGPAVKVFPDQKSHSKLHNCSASNVGSAAERIIASDICIYGRDARNNQTALPPGRTVYCFLRRGPPSNTQTVNGNNSGISPSLGGSIQCTQETLPALVGADPITGRLRHTVEPGRINVSFILELQPEIGSIDGAVEIVFGLEPEQDGEVEDPNALFCHAFTFLTNKAKIRETKELQKKQQELEAFVTDYEEKRNFAEGSIQEANETIESFMNRGKTDYMKKLKIAYDDDGNDSDGKFSDQLKKEISKMSDSIKKQDTSQYRQIRFNEAAQKGMAFNKQMADASNVKYVGHVGELGFVDDEEEAKLLSHVAHTFLDLLVTEGDRKQTYDLVNKHPKVNCWPLADIKTFKYKNVKGDQIQRNDHDRATGMLPCIDLTSPDNKSDHTTVRGNPRAMVNIIKLSREHEHLRETVFYSIFRDLILFDDKESMLDWKQQALKYNPRRIIPTMWALKEGYQAASDGRLDSRSSFQSGGDKPRKCVFGATPPSKNLQLNDLKQDKDLCAKILLCLSTREAAQREMDELENIDQQYHEKKSELQEVNDTLLQLMQELGV